MQNPLQAIRIKNISLKYNDKLDIQLNSYSIQIYNAPKLKTKPLKLDSGMTARQPFRIYSAAQKTQHQTSLKSRVRE